MCVKYNGTHIGIRYVISPKHWMWLPDDGFMWTETCWSNFYKFSYFNSLRILKFVCISWTINVWYYRCTLQPRSLLIWAIRHSRVLLTKSTLVQLSSNSSHFLEYYTRITLLSNTPSLALIINYFSPAHLCTPYFFHKHYNVILPYMF